MWGSVLSGAFTAFKIRVSGFGDVALLLCPKISLETLLLVPGSSHLSRPWEEQICQSSCRQHLENVKNNSPCPQELFDLFGFRTVLTLFNSWIVNFPNLHYFCIPAPNAESLFSLENSKYCLKEVTKINSEYTRSRKNIYESLRKIPLRSSNPAINSPLNHVPKHHTYMFLKRNQRNLISIPSDFILPKNIPSITGT